MVTWSDVGSGVLGESRQLAQFEDRVSMLMPFVPDLLTNGDEFVALRATWSVEPRMCSKCVTGFWLWTTQ